LRDSARAVAFAAGLLIGLASCAEASELTEQVRALNALQGSMVQGAPGARAAIPAQIERIEQAVASLDDESWKEKGNSAAAAIFLFCGGPSRSIRKILDAHLIPEAETPLVAGAVAYAEGRNDDAAKLLTRIDARAMSDTLAAHLALIQGGLLIATDKAKARELFDLARLLMPSSLVEEAALRREMSVVDVLQDTNKFLVLGRRYGAQYAKSPFSRNYWDEMRAATLRASADGDNPRLGEFRAMMKGASPALRFETHMSVARHAILGGRVALATTETQYAGPLADSPAARARVELYRAALAGLAGDFETAEAEFQKIDLKSVPSADVEVRNIVTAAISRLQGASEGVSSATPSPPAAEATRPESTVERSAQQALTDADALLQRATRR
jgi:chemotaxis protein MotC